MKKTFLPHVPVWWTTQPSLKDNVFATYEQQNLSELYRLREIPVKFPNYNIDTVIGRLSRDVGLTMLYNNEQLTYNYFYYLNQLRLAWFQYTMNDCKPVTLTLVDRQIQTTGKFKNDCINSTNVAEGILIALLLRDKTALNYLAQIPVSFTEQANQDDLLVEITMAFYQLVAKGNNSPKEAQATFYHIKEQFDWEVYKKYVTKEGFNQEWVWKIIFENRKEYAEFVSLPVINIYYQIWENSQAGFEDAVKIALEHWKVYYTRTWIDENKEDQDRSLWGQGYLSLPIAAACAYAHDRGMRLTTIESNYIPQWLIEGNFDGMELLIND